MVNTTAGAVAEYRERAREALRVAFEPPPEISIDQWADAERVLSSEFAAEPGQWSTDRAPYLREIMRTISDDAWQEVVLKTASQVGKSSVLENTMGYYMQADPSPIIIVRETDAAAKKWSKERLAPMIRDTPALRNTVAPEKSRDGSNTIGLKKFPGGFLAVVGANVPGELAARSVRVALGDEIDRWAASAGQEGDPIKLVTRRTTTFQERRKLIWVSTPTIKGISRIDDAFALSDQRYFHVPCPHCAFYQRWIWPNLRGWRIAEGEYDADRAQMVCTECGAFTEEHQKHELLMAGKWVATHPGRKVAGFQLSALYSPWVTWADFATEFLEARGNPEKMKVWVNTFRGLSYEDPGRRLDKAGLAERLTDYGPKGQVPNGVGLLTAAVDVQVDRLELQVTGWGAAEASWLVDFQQLDGDPGEDAVWRVLDEHLKQRYPHIEGGTLRITATAIDTGFQAEQVYRFCASRARRKVWAVKGASQPNKPIVGRPSRNNKMKVRLFLVGTDTAKDLIFSRLRIPEPLPGKPYIHLPEWADDEYLSQLTAEEARVKWVRGRKVRVYEKIRDRPNEALDLTVYSLAALLTLGPLALKRLGTLATEVTERGRRLRAIERGDTPAPKATGKKSRKKKSTWGNRWKQ